VLKGSLVAEDAFDVAGSDEKLRVRIYAPVCEADGTWACWAELDEPIGWSGNTYGASALQALTLGVRTISIHLYASDEYKDGRLGVDGVFGGFLGIPAPTDYLDFAPFPF